MAAIFNFVILRVIPYFDSMDPVQIRFSMLQTSYMQIFMLSSGSAHLFDISTQLLDTCVMTIFVIISCIQDAELYPMSLVTMQYRQLYAVYACRHILSMGSNIII